MRRRDRALSALLALSLCAAAAEAQRDDRALAEAEAGGPVRQAFSRSPAAHEQWRGGAQSAPGLRRWVFFESERGGRLYAVGEHVDAHGRVTRAAGFLGVCGPAEEARVVDWDFGPELAVVEVVCPDEVVRVYLHLDRRQGRVRRVLTHPVRARHVRGAEARWDAARREVRVVTRPRIPDDDPHVGHPTPEPTVQRFRWTGSTLRPVP